MNADTDEFEISDRSYLHRAAVSALALLGLAAILAATLQLMGSAYGAAPLPVAAADAAPLDEFPGGHDLRPAADEIPLAEYYSVAGKDAADTTAILDALFTLIASGCLLFLAYGAWLCATVRVRARSDGAQRSAAPECAAAGTSTGSYPG